MGRIGSLLLSLALGLSWVRAFLHLETGLGSLGRRGIGRGYRLLQLQLAGQQMGRESGGSDDGEAMSEEEEARMREMINKLYAKEETLNPKDFPELLLEGYEGEVETVYRETAEFASIFDDVELLSQGPKINGYDRNSIATQTLREISECYGFSLAFLGDFVVELGAYPPVNIDTEICTYLTGDQIYSLLQSLNSLEPGAASIEYDSTSASELCELLGLSTQTLLRICSAEGFNLPFGLESVLHSSVIERISQCATHDEYRATPYQDLEMEGDAESGGDSYLQ